MHNFHVRGAADERADDVSGSAGSSNLNIRAESRTCRT